MNLRFWRVCPLSWLLATFLAFTIPTGSASRKFAPWAVFTINHGGLPILGRSAAVHFCRLGSFDTFAL